MQANKVMQIPYSVIQSKWKFMNALLEQERRRGFLKILKHRLHSKKFIIVTQTTSSDDHIWAKTILLAVLHAIQSDDWPRRWRW